MGTEKEVKAEQAVEAAGAIPAKYLKGLVYNGANHEEVFDKKLGRKKAIHTPFERALAAADVNSWSDYGDTVVICTKDGKKHTVKK